MKEQALFLLDGYYKGYKEETEQSKIVAILDPNTGIFKGIEILSNECNIKDYEELFHYVCKCYHNFSQVSLVVGYYDRKILQYQILLPNHFIGFGYFEQNEVRLIGREKKFENYRFSRNLKRPVNRYDAMIITQQFVSILGKAEFVVDLVNNFTDLYEVIEAILMKRNHDNIWKGLQISAENMAPHPSCKTYMLVPSKYEITL